MKGAWATLLLAGCAAPLPPPTQVGPPPEAPAPGADQADREFVLEGLFQTTGTWLDRDRRPAGTIELKRVRPEFSGHIRGVRFKVEPKFTVDEVHLEEAWAGVDVLSGSARLMVGRVKVPFGLEEVRSRRHIDFPSFSAVNQFSPAEDEGVLLDGELGSGAWEYGLSLTAGAAGSSGRTRGELGGRLMSHPFSQASGSNLESLGLGISATAGRPRGKIGGTGLSNGSGSEVVTFAAGTHLSGLRTRVGLEGEWSLGPLFTQAEVVHIRQHMGSQGQPTESVDLSGAYLTLSYALTGEEKTFAGVEPSSPHLFGTGTGRGAWVLAMRISQLNLDEDIQLLGLTEAGRFTDRIRSTSIGLNWIPNKNMILRNALIWSDYADEISLGRGSDDHEVALALELQVHF